MSMSEADEMLNLVGDKVVDMFEQMEKGKWTDEHGHEVKMNVTMIALLDAMQKAWAYRQKRIVAAENDLISKGITEMRKYT